METAQRLQSSSLDSFYQNPFGKPFGFHSKTEFDAKNALLLTRSDTFLLIKPPKQEDIWRRKPPSFCYDAYDPKPPTRNSREAMQPWRYGTFPGDWKRQKEEMQKQSQELVLPNILKPKKPQSPVFQTRFKIHDPFEAKKDSVKRLTFKKDQFENPTPHDFRQYPPLKKLGLPEFETKHEKDPGNINFKSKRLNQISGLAHSDVGRDVDKGRQMYRPKIPEPKWDAKLIHPKEEWPNRYYAYTRFRRPNRRVHSAFMERVEDQLTEQWNQEREQQSPGRRARTTGVSLRRNTGQGGVKERTVVTRA
ncbi:hypothetical protein Bbelb_330820 [Branchiostoma belcheri]|nr:hypothetical protein Bbelb_330820 [Branchiostoma belcheri]